MYGSKPAACDVFVSYAHKDKDRALALVELLKGRGLNCWFDVDGLRGGVDYEREILDAIRGAAVVMALLSEAALNSNYVRYEVGAARGVGKPVVQVMLDSLPVQSLNEPFSAREQLVDLSGGIVEGVPLDGLVKDLKGWSTSAKSKRQVKLALAVVAVILMFFGARHLFMMQPTLGNMLANGAPPGSGFTFAASAGAAEISPGLLAYAPLSAAKPDSSGQLHPQIAFDVFGLKANATNWIPLGSGRSLRSGEHFFIRAETFTPGFLYIFLVDSSGKLQWLFPTNTTFPYSYGTNFVVSRVALSLPPAENQAYKLDEVTGEERIFAIYSASRWKELELALEQAGDPKSSEKADRQIESLLAITDALAERTKGISTVEETRVIQSVRQSTGSGQGGFLVDLPARSARAKDHWLLEVRRFEHLPAADGQ